MTEPQGKPLLPKATDLLDLYSRPADVIACPTWGEARGKILTLVIAGTRFIALLGAPGSGKTTLLRDLAGTLGERGYAACLLDLGNSPTGAETSGIVLIDEADRMSPTQLEALCRGSDSAVVLAALPGFGEYFQRQYPDVAIVALTELLPDEAFAFLAERLAQLGLPITCLNETAWAQLIRHGRGVPRLLVALLKLTLLIAAENHAECVTGAHVDLAVEVRHGSAATTEVACDLMQSDSAVQNAPTTIPLPVTRADANEGKGGNKATRHRWRGPAAAAALTAVSVIAATLSQTRWNADETVTHRSDTSPISVAMREPESATAKTPQAGAPPPSDPSATTAAVRAMTTEQNAAQSRTFTPAALELPAPAGMAPKSSATPVSSGTARPFAADNASQPQPAGDSIRVVLVYPRGNAAAAKQGAEVARTLRADGLQVTDPVPIAPQWAKHSIRYYFTQDADAAAEIARRLRGEYGGAKMVRSQRHLPGTIEVAIGPG
jgi:energy-coupling factor transporter ATP-binding protein EcfA2